MFDLATIEINDDDVNTILPYDSSLMPFTQLTTNLTGYLEQHHALYSEVPVKGTYWEKLYALSLITKFPNTALSWKHGSHGVGSDITFGDTRISNKSGSIVGRHKDRVNIGGKRLESLKGDIEAIKLHIEQSKTEDYHCCLSTYNTLPKNTPANTMVYELLVFPHTLIDFTSGEWTTYGTHNNLRFVDKYGAKVEVHQTASYQMWYNLPLKKAVFREQIKIKY